MVTQTTAPPTQESPSGPRDDAKSYSPRRTRLSIPRLVWFALAAVLVGVPVIVLIAQSITLPDGSIGLANYAEVFGNEDLLQAIGNSLWIGTGTTVGALLIALPMAYLIARTDMPGRRFVQSVAMLTFAAPSFLAALGWILLAGPNNGLLNQALQGVFGDGAWRLNVFGPWGIIFILSLFSYPLVLLPVAAALENLDSSTEHAAANLGASPWTVLRRITFPLVMPAIFAGARLVFISSFVVFGAVALLGTPVGFDTLATAMLRLMRFPPSIELAAVVALPTLLMVALLIWLQRRIERSRGYAVLSGKSGQRSRAQLGRWRLVALGGCLAVLVFSLVLPFGVLVLTSFRKAIGVPLSWDNFVLFDNYAALIERPELLMSLVHSLILAAVAVIGAVLVSLLAAWLIERTRARSNRLIEPVMLTPLALPGAVLGIAMVVAFARPPWQLGGTLVIIGLAYLIHALPLTFSYIHAGMRQISPSLEEAGSSLGAGMSTVMRKVSMPLLKSSLVSVVTLQFVLLFRELEISIFLYTGSNDVASVVLYNLASESQFQVMGAFSTVVLVINVGLVLVARRFLLAEFRR